MPLHMKTQTFNEQKIGVVNLKENYIITDVYNLNNVYQNNCLTKMFNVTHIKYPHTHTFRKNKTFKHVSHCAVIFYISLIRGNGPRSQLNILLKVQSVPTALKVCFYLYLFIGLN